MSNCCGDVVYRGKCKRGRQVQVLDCTVCGFKHLHPKPSEAELASYYKKAYFKTEKPDYAKTSGTGSEYQFIVDKEKIEVAFAGSSWHGRIGPQVLDYGCGPTAPFLKHFTEVWDSGLDSHSDPMEACQCFGYEPSLSVGKKEPFPISPTMPNGKFDVIHLGFVLEHVASPHEILTSLKKRLEPGGHLIVEVPNDFNALQMAIWEKGQVPWWVSSPDHANYLSVLSLGDLLRHCGFTPWALRTTYPVELFLLHGQDFRKNPAASKTLVKRRAGLQRVWRDTKMEGVGVGRTVWMVASGA